MISFIKGAKKAADYPASEAEVVFVGRSNVGKSSLINALYKNNLAYTGKTAGKTRMLNFFDIEGKYTICDVPGYGYAKRNDREIIEYGEMMEEYFSKRSQLRLCVCIFDSRIEPTEDDKDMIEFLKALKIPYVIVYNKTDKLTAKEKNALKTKINGLTWLVSSKTKLGIKELREGIESYI